VLPITRNYILVYIYAEEPWVSENTPHPCCALIKTCWYIVVKLASFMFITNVIVCSSILIMRNQAELPEFYFISVFGEKPDIIHGQISATWENDQSKAISPFASLSLFNPRFHNDIPLGLPPVHRCRFMLTDQRLKRLPKRVSTETCHYAIIVPSRSIKV